MIIDLSFHHRRLYEGCRVTEFEGKLHLETPPQTAAPIIRRNVAAIVAEMGENREEVILTGRAMVWVYLTVACIVVPVFRRVLYSDGRSKPFEVKS